MLGARLLGCTGGRFGEQESYDYAVVDSGELARIVAYIENDPVKRAEDHAWSSVCLKWRERLERQAFTRV